MKGRAKKNTPKMMADENVGMNCVPATKPARPIMNAIKTKNDAVIGRLERSSIRSSVEIRGRASRNFSTTPTSLSTRSR